MFRAIFIVGLFLFSFFQINICPADEPIDKNRFLEKLGEALFGEERAGTLDVDSEPRGAMVYVDGVLKGKTPCSLGGIAPGRWTVQVELDEYVPQENTVEVTEDETQALKFILERARPNTATGVKLTADPARSCLKGTAVTFKAEGSGGTGKYEYRFFMKGPATGDKWVKKQRYSAKNTWTWMTSYADVGRNEIVVHVRSSGSKAKKEAQKGTPYFVSAVAPAKGAKLTADPAGPCYKGTAVTFKAEGSGGTGKYEYRFLMIGPATGDKWVKKQRYSAKNTWTWMTSDADVGANKIVVQVRSSGSKAKKEALKGILYEVNAGEPPSPDRRALEEFLQELEQKIEDGDKRMVAHPTFLEELRDLVKRYQRRIMP
jgi:PEGA domain-containing protein